MRFVFNFAETLNILWGGWETCLALVGSRLPFPEIFSYTKPGNCESMCLVKHKQFLLWDGVAAGKRRNTPTTPHDRLCRRRHCQISTVQFNQVSTSCQRYNLTNFQRYNSIKFRPVFNVVGFWRDGVEWHCSSNCQTALTPIYRLRRDHMPSVHMLDDIIHWFQRNQALVNHKLLIGSSLVNGNRLTGVALTESFPIKSEFRPCTAVGGQAFA
jgi:hypothetical protein